jgi:AcrR family transcriptional regulator
VLRTARPKEKPSPRPAPALRREPSQKRSRERVERILDAATRVFAEVGYDAATTEAIAARAGTSIGSLYQFFPNKKALFDAIGRAYLEESQQIFHALMAKAAGKPWTELVDEALDAFWEHDRKSLAFRAVWANFQFSAEFFARGEAMNREIASGVAKLIGAIAPHLAEDRRALVATMLVEATSAMLFVALRRGERGAAIVDETKVMVKRYLAPYAEAAARAGGGRGKREGARAK